MVVRASQVEVGPWGGDGGVNPWSFMPGGRIVGFRIASGDVIDSIRFMYEDESHNKHHSNTYGGDGGTLNPPVNFDRDEDIIRVSGTIGKIYSYTVITSLSFHTNKGRTYGTYGGGAGTSFSLPVTKGKFIGFFGNYGDYLDSIGETQFWDEFGLLQSPSIDHRLFQSIPSPGPSIDSILFLASHPVPSLKLSISKFLNLNASQVEVGPWGGDGGVNPWSFMPGGRIVGFRIASGDVIDSIRFMYEDESHNKHHSNTYGGDGGTLNPPVNFDRDEDIIRVSGTIGKIYSYTVITSLSFHTNKGRTYGTYGGGAGTSFSLPVTKGKFIGFFGNYGDYLDSIGVILQP
ncbi:hypothetical protein L6452_35870 [Arctium lappa]|uniref:Uncharacterized protein n=1 Tax=Arctium lappa TaxID=4217 RepID=A0ACB8Y8U2_ARCLA|nr:hypothetical protein L6452_35870 [Arctium lappa]